MPELTKHVDHLRWLAQLDLETSLLDLALVNVLEDMAVARSTDGQKFPS